jgi:tripartite-type tricarboxylate transporter receptor subunit TctC
MRSCGERSVFPLHRLLVRGLLLALLGCCAPLAQSQNYPAKPVKLVIPYPPGGIADTVARLLAQYLSDRLGKPFLPDNKPGGSLIIGTDAVAKSPADGYTLLFASSSSLALNVGAFRKLPYDPVKDFAPVSVVFSMSQLLMITPELPIASVKDLIAYAKAKPGDLSFASLGHGSTLHIAGEKFKTLAGIDLLHVAYKGTTTALPDLISGRVSMIFDGGALLPQVEAGKLRLLAVTSPKRLETMPDVPTMAEAGVPGFEMALWFGIVAPAGTPKPVVDLLAKEIADITSQHSFRERLRSFGNVQPESDTPEAFSRLIARDIQSWTRALKDAGVEPQ